VYSRDSTVEGIDLYHYVVADYEFYNGSTYPPNYGYSAFGKPGVLNITAVSPQSQLTSYVCFVVTFVIRFTSVCQLAALP